MSNFKTCLKCKNGISISNPVKETWNMLQNYVPNINKRSEPWKLFPVNTWTTRSVYTISSQYIFLYFRHPPTSATLRGVGLVVCYGRFGGTYRPHVRLFESWIWDRHAARKGRQPPTHLRHFVSQKWVSCPRLICICGAVLVSRCFFIIYVTTRWIFKTFQLDMNTAA